MPLETFGVVPKREDSRVCVRAERSASLALGRAPRCRARESLVIRSGVSAVVQSSGYLRVAEECDTRATAELAFGN